MIPALPVHMLTARSHFPDARERFKLGSGTPSGQAAI